MTFLTTAVVGKFRTEDYILEKYKINIFWDNEAEVWVAISDDIPLALENDSLDRLIERIKIVAPEILFLNSSTNETRKKLHEIEIEGSYSFTLSNTT